MAQYITYNEAEADTTDAPAVRIWEKRRRQPLGRLLVWNAGSASGIFSIIRGKVGSKHGKCKEFRHIPLHLAPFSAESYYM